MKPVLKAVSIALLAMSAIGSFSALPALADETCNSPYMRKLILGQEQYVHVWTLGMKGVGDGSDKLVTVDVDPKSARYGQVIDSISVGGRGEVHHMGFTDDRKYLWAGRLDDSQIFVFDVGTDPASPKLVKKITKFAEDTGYVGPHTFYALPGRMLIGALSNTKDYSGRTGMAMYNNRGDLINTYDVPANDPRLGGDGYLYDIAISPNKNAMLTSSFTGHNNYMRDFDKLVSDPEAMRNFGNTMVLWNHKSMKPEKVFDVPGAPLEVRWSLNKNDNWAITATALTSQLWLVRQDANGQWQSKAVAPIGDPASVPLPVDISITADSKGLWVNTFMDGKTRYFDITDPEHPRQTYERVIGKQANMVSQSWDGKRLYITASLLANWDKKGDAGEQYLRAFAWDGTELKPLFDLDFVALGLGRAHHMKFSAKGEKHQNDESALVSMATKLAKK